MEHVDVLIIGAGLSGIGAACHFSSKCPDKNYLILEGRENLGGTWDLFRYPGIRSDSDMFTLGYNFKPWTGPKLLADGPSILEYIKEAAEEYKVTDKIRYQSFVNKISWNSDDAKWSVFYTDKGSNEEKQLTCCFIESCTGYYNYDHGYQPEFEGLKSYQGTFVHPQFWPEDLDYKNKKVVVIGSGATAVTVVPEMAKDTKEMTMLQRSPTYMASLPGIDGISEWMRKYLPEKVVYRISRTRQATAMYSFYALSRRYPEPFKKLLLKGVEKQIGNVDMKHFTPDYNPWDQRLCAVKSGDLFKGVSDGSINMVTDHIDHFTEKGIKLKSGNEIEADIVVSATGLELKFLGGIDVDVDGEHFECSEKMSYKGIMLEGLPNLGFTFGYTNASWTLKADLTAEWICRLVNMMDKKGKTKVVPENSDPSVEVHLLLDFKSGYVQRALNRFPKMGNKYPWKLIQGYPIDLALLRYGRMDDGKLKFS